VRLIRRAIEISTTCILTNVDRAEADHDAPAADRPDRGGQAPLAALAADRSDRDKPAAAPDKIAGRARRNSLQQLHSPPPKGRATRESQSKEAVSLFALLNRSSQVVSTHIRRQPDNW